MEGLCLIPSRKGTGEAATATVAGMITAKIHLQLGQSREERSSS